jgi:hypothetical protein
MTNRSTTNRSMPQAIANHGLAMLTAMLTFAFALTALASPGHAQSANRLSSARAAAIHECSVSAGRYTQHTWGDVDIQLYRSCMAQHGYTRTGRQ